MGVNINLSGVPSTSPLCEPKNAARLVNFCARVGVEKKYVEKVPEELTEINLFGAADDTTIDGSAAQLTEVPFHYLHMFPNLKEIIIMQQNISELNL